MIIMVALFKKIYCYQHSFEATNNPFMSLNHSGYHNYYLIQKNI